VAVSASSPCPPDPEVTLLRAVRDLRYRSREHAYRAEVALDGGDLAEFARMRHLAALEREVADDMEAKGR
jgi:hypothetical protein